MKRPKKKPEELLVTPKCCGFATDVIYRDEDVWRLDTNDGLAGYLIKYCPNCGTKLES